MLTMTLKNWFRFLTHILIALPLLLAAAVTPAAAGEMRPYPHPDVGPVSDVPAPQPARWTRAPPGACPRCVPSYCSSLTTLLNWR